MEYTANQISQLIKGKVEGNSEARITGMSKIEQGQADTITFLSNPKYEEFIYSTGASVAIVENDFLAAQSLPESLTLIRVANPRIALAELMNAYLVAKQPAPGRHMSASVADSAIVPDSCYLGPNVVVESNARLGENCILQANVVIGSNTIVGEGSLFHSGVKILAESKIGNQCTFQTGAIIGSDGFGFAPNAENHYMKVPHIGNVVIEDHVEIGANTTIDRATMGSTIIRKGVKLDNLIQVAHNVEIGENTVIAAQTGVAGSTKIGKNCMIGGQVGIVGHLEIADEVKIAAQSGIGYSIKEKGQIVQGSPAFGIGEYKRSYVQFRSLPSLDKRISELEKKLKD